MLAAMFPRLGSSKLISTWILITLGASIFAAIDGGWLARWTAFAPGRIWHGELWRLLTWVFVERSPMCLILTCVCIYQFGGGLAPRWGERRLRRFLVEILGGAAVVATLLAWTSDDLWSLQRVGGWAVCDAIVIAWGRQYPAAIVRLYGLVQVNGKKLVAFTLGVTALYAIFRGPLTMAPEILTCAASYLYPESWLARRV